jgi:hypothetical protein
VRALGRSFYRAKSPSTSGTTSRNYSRTELKIDPWFVRILHDFDEVCYGHSLGTGPWVDWIRVTRHRAGDGATTRMRAPVACGWRAVALWRCLRKQGTLTQVVDGLAMGLGDSWASAGLCVEEGRARPSWGGGWVSAQRQRENSIALLFLILL